MMYGCSHPREHVRCGRPIALPVRPIIETIPRPEAGSRCNIQEGTQVDRLSRKSKIMNHIWDIEI